jgi:ribosomal protein S4
MTNLSYGGRIEINTLPVEGFSNKKIEEERKRKEKEDQKQEEQLRNEKMRLEKLEEERKQQVAEKDSNEQQVHFSVINLTIRSKNNTQTHNMI